MAGGGTVRGVIPQVLTQWEHQQNDITELVVVEDMHVRKRTLYEMCDAALVLPGGFGTLDELFEICDRLVVIAQGRVSPGIAAADASVERIGEWMSGLWDREAKAAHAEA